MRLLVLIWAPMLLCFASGAMSPRDTGKTLGSRKVQTDAYGDPLPSGALLRLGTLRYRTGEIIDSLSISADRKLGMCTERTGRRRLQAFDVQTGQMRTLLQEVAEGVFSPTGHVFACVAERGQVIYIQDADTGKLLRKLKGHGKWISQIVFGPKKGILASAAPDANTLKVWDWEKGEELRTISVDKCRAIAFSPDGET